RAELAPCESVAPVAEAALGVLHDVALVHQRHALAPLGAGAPDRRADQAFRALARDRLDAAGRGPGEPDAADRHLALQEADQLARLVTAGGKLDAGVDVLGILAEDHHVDRAGILDRRRHATEPAHRAHAGIQVELLAQRHVERTEATTHR